MIEELSRFGFVSRQGVGISKGPDQISALSFSNSRAY
jgi:hypothetical protein